MTALRHDAIIPIVDSDHTLHKRLGTCMGRFKLQALITLAYIGHSLNETQVPCAVASRCSSGHLPQDARVCAPGRRVRAGIGGFVETWLGGNAGTHCIHFVLLIFYLQLPFQLDFLHIAAEVAFDLLRFAMIWDDYLGSPVTCQPMTSYRGTMPRRMAMPSPR